VIVLDTGVLYAAADRRDDDHERCAAFFEDHADDLLALPAAVAVETAWMIGSRLGSRAEALFLTTVAAGALTVHDLDQAGWGRAAELVEAYADLHLGTVDACVIACAERIGTTTVATLNHRDFRVVRPAHVDALTLVP
jgi:hypothetical protein